MIFYKNFVKNKKPKRKNIEFSIFADGIENLDDSVAKPNSCKSFYNLSFIDGALKTGLGFSDLSVPSSETDLDNQHTFNFAEKLDEIKGIWLDRWFNTADGKYRYQLIMMDSAFNLFAIQLIDNYNGVIFAKYQGLKTAPTFQCAYRIENQDCCLFFTEEGMLYLSMQQQNLIDKVPAMISCVVHYDRFFGVTNKNRNTLIYTANLNLKNWDEAQSSTIEFLDNRGSFTKLVAFNDYVYLFRENGITKISIYNSKDDFSFTHLYNSSSKIYENSVCVCGDKIFFATRDGLHTFNGNSVNKILDNYDVYFKNLDNSNCSSACLDGKYYLATKCAFAGDEKVGCESGDFVNNVLFEIDINSFAVNICRGVDIRKLLAVDNPYLSKLCACFYNENKQRIGQLERGGKIFESANAKQWKSHQTDLGESGLKRIKEILITTKYPCTVKVTSDMEEKIFEFDGNANLQRKKANLKGNVFQFTFETKDTNCDIKKPIVVYDVV